MNEKWYFDVKYGVLNNIYKSIGVPLHKDTIMNQFHIHCLYTWSYFESPNQFNAIFKKIQNE
jgi:hypothetical protein